MPLIEVIEEDLSCPTLSPRDIVNDVVVAPISLVELQNECTLFLKKNSTTQRHEIQVLLFKIAICLQNQQKQRIQENLIQDSLVPCEEIMKILQSSFSLSQWRNKCLVLLICSSLVHYSKIREEVITFIQSVAYSLVCDSHEEIWICFCQFMEILIQLSSTPSIHLFDWNALFHTKQFKKEWKEDTWLNRIDHLLQQKSISLQSHFHSLLLQLTQLSKDSLSYENSIHSLLDILLGYLSQKSYQDQINKEVLTNWESFLPFLPSNLSLDSLSSQSLHQTTIQSHLFFFFFSIGQFSREDFPPLEDFFNHKSILLIQTTLFYYYWFYQGKLQSSQSLSLEHLLLSSLTLLHAIYSHQSTDSILAQQILWTWIDQLIQIRQGKWLSPQLLNRVLFVHFMSTSHSLTGLETQFKSTRAIVQFLGNEAIQSVYWLMRYIKPLNTLKEEHYFHDYFIANKEINHTCSISYILFILQHISLSTHVGNSGLFCQWFLQLLSWNNLSTAETDSLFQSICQAFLVFLQHIPQLTLLPYYQQSISELFNIISFNKLSSQLVLLYSILHQFFHLALIDQSESVSSVCIDSFHAYVKQLPTLTLSFYPIHIQQFIQTIHILPDKVVIPEIQAILNFLEHCFSDSTCIADAVVNIDLLICLCEDYSQQMYYHIHTLLQYGFDSLVYIGKMREMKEIETFHKKCVVYWVLLIEIRTKEVEKYLKGFYQRIEHYKMDRVIDIRSEIQDAFSQHIEKDHCQACSMNNPLDL